MDEYRRKAITESYLNDAFYRLPSKYRLIAILISFLIVFLDTLFSK